MYFLNFWRQSMVLTQDVGRRGQLDQSGLLDDEPPRLVAQLDQRLGERPHVHPTPRQRRLRRVSLGRALEVSGNIDADCGNSVKFCFFVQRKPHLVSDNPTLYITTQRG